MLSLLQAIGGIGVFLLGMIVMTEGLKSLAGARVNRWLVSATHSPASGAMTGAVASAVLRSSSATTVAAVGFVGAGLLTFPQALGILFGANIGTTFTGWVVALLGFKFKLGSLLLPLVFGGVLIRMFASPRMGQVGYALAGFGLVFVGVDLLQQAAAEYTGLIRADMMPEDGWAGRFQLLLLGMLVTLITQSSSAGVAATLVVLNAGAIGFEQAAALVIGMDVGTTVTAAIATIGGSVGMRRTGYSHVIYNLFTGLGAMLLITPFVVTWEVLAPGQLLLNAEIALVAFHTTFNVLGVILVLPLSARFANLMQRLVPDTQALTASNLDKSLLKEPGMALMAVEKIILNEFLTMMVNINLIFEQKVQEIRADMSKQKRVLNETHEFLDQIHVSNPQELEGLRLIALIHAIDHMQRLHERCDEDLERAVVASTRQELSEVESIMDLQIDQIIKALEARDWERAGKLSNQNYQRIHQLEQPQRESIYRAVARGEMDVHSATQCAEALRWLTRVSRHIARICFYLGQVNQESKT